MPSQAPNAFRDADWSASDELIVATEHLGFVRDLIGGRITARIDSRNLGLTRLHLSVAEALADLQKAITETPRADQVRAALRAQAAALLPPASTSETAGGGSGDLIAEVATDLRALAAAQHGGWMPTLGRNRLVTYPGDGSIGATSETPFGTGGTGRLTVTSETPFGGGGVPRPLTGSKWSPPRARTAGPGGGVRIGILDTGLWPHPWLAGGWVAEPSAVLRDEGLDPISGHGTFVAGLVLSQAPGATIDARRVLFGKGQGNAWDAAEVIAELGQGAVSVLNLSFACYTADGQPPLVLARAIDRVNADIAVVAAAGNHAGVVDQSAELAQFAALPSWPAALDDVIAVGALDRDGEVASFSPDRPWVDVAARGVDLRSTFLPRAVAGGYPVEFGEGWAEWSGTSFSAALISGAIAAGIDPGRRSGAEVVEDMMYAAAIHTVAGGMPKASSAHRLNLRTTGWARG